MLAIVIRVYEYLRSHRVICIISFLLITSILSFMLVNQTYKEDISDFLPLNNKYNKALKVYQDISGSSKIFAIIQYSDSMKSDPDSIVMAIDAFVSKIKKSDKAKSIRNLTYQIDIEQLTNISSFIYHNIPYFLSFDDYHRIDSLLSTSDFIRTQIADDKQMLMFPASNLLAENIQRDPLNIFTPVLAQLQKQQMGLKYENYDGYIFTPDMKRGIIIMETPFGGSETEQNGQLLKIVEGCANEVTEEMPEMSINLTGGPVIAVGNARQIKNDSLISICFAVVLIVLFLSVVFRNMWNLLLIVISIGWGWLFAMGFLAFFHNGISIIVVGISSVILGIAVNYPLHLIAHLQHNPDIKSTLKEISMPLIIGNITTVGAFLALVPLKSIALRDLGLFSSMLLIGTIVFVLLYLPHLLKPRRGQNNTFLNRIGNISIENKRWIVYSVVILTVIFAYCSVHTEFDSNMNHINYMTEEQKNDLAYFQSMLPVNSTKQAIYVVNSSQSLDSALNNSLRLSPLIDKMTLDGDIIGNQNCNQFICSKKEQERRLSYWDSLISKYGADIEQKVLNAAKEENFQDGTFDEFFNILNSKYEPKSEDYFNLLTSTVFASNISVDEMQQTYNVIDVLYTEKSNIDAIINKVEEKVPSCYAFDVQGMNSSIATRLSEDFNYIGWACGLIVFFFLWFSFGSIELAILSFLPMAISWIWILGIMSILGIQFNVINVILATFIFGQGDDYTIFMTEGCQYEYAYRRKMLSSYKNSIIISALIMFIGIGSLIIAKHPALHSLAEVTIVGMFSVVLMAYLFPPLIYKWLVSTKGNYRIRPIRLKAAFITGYCAVVFFSQLATVYILGFVLFVICRPNSKSKSIFRNYIRRFFWFDMNHIECVPFSYENPYEETFSNPSVIVCNHQSMLDTAYLMSISSKIAIVANTHARNHLATRKVFEWMDFYAIPNGESPDENRLLSLINAGYSIVFFPEGERNVKSSILRFHKGAFYFADKYNLDIVPIFLHGVNYVFPRNTICTYPGKVTLKIEKRIKPNTSNWGDNYVERTKMVRQFYIQEYARLKNENETLDYYYHFILDRYRYKGRDIFSSVKRGLNQLRKSYQENSALGNGNTIVINSQWGEIPLLLALLNPKNKIFSVVDNEEMECIARHSSEEIVNNVVFHKKLENDELAILESQYGPLNVIMLYPTPSDINKYQKYNPYIIH